MEDKEINNIYSNMRTKQKSLDKQLDRIKKLAAIGEKVEKPKLNDECPKCNGRLSAYWVNDSRNYTPYRYYQCDNENCDYEYAYESSFIDSY